MDVPVDDWRERLIRILLIVASTLGALAVGYNLLFVAGPRPYLWLTFYTLSVIPAWMRSLPVRVRLGFLFGGWYLLGVTSLASVGFLLGPGLLFASL
ncbi:MAG: hypothetical protein AB2A00_37795, partial [Myxococcota bacterium]